MTFGLSACEVRGSGLNRLDTVPHVATTNVEPKPETASMKRRLNALARRRMKQRQATDEYQLSQRCRKKIE